MQFHSKSSEDIENIEMSLQKAYSKIKLNSIKRRCNLCTHAETPFYTMRGTDYLESFSLPSNNFLSFAQEANEEPLIQPCFCNTLVHKKCLKHFIIEKQTHQCSNCGGKYQARSTQNELAKFNIVITWFSESAQVIWKGVLNLFVSIIMGLFLMRVIEQHLNKINYFLYAKKRTDTELYQDIILKIFVYFLYALNSILTLCYMFIIIVNNIRRSVIYDIEIYCYQQNIESHSTETITIIQKFYKKIRASGIFDQFRKNNPSIQEAPILSKIFSHRDFDKLKEN